MTQPTEQDRPMSAIEDMLLKFTSGNDVAVQRAVITLDEWRATYAEYMALQARVAEIEAERDGLAAKLADAAASLNTIATQSGKEPFMQSMIEVRSYARSRAMCAGYEPANQIEGGA